MEPGTSEPGTPANGPTSFWKTMPGCLTAVAGVITAIGTLVAALAAAGVIGGSHSAIPPSTGEPVPPTTQASPSQPAPEQIG